ncbi:DUF1501 domain-containing protein [Akkermansiaceae bacterium]|nr:DUF1501 domain-containing protein [Akkermansiaceae bacterium]
MGKLAAEEAPADESYRALVCVFLQGGNDSYNMLVPRGESEYEEYAEVRGSLSLPREDLLSLTGPLNQGKELGLHPSLTRLKEIYEGGEAAFVSNVGTLQQPTTRADYEANASLLPKGLFSHSDQQRQWQTAVADRAAKSGWLGRMADVIQSGDDLNHYASAISVSGINLSQTAPETVPYVIGPNGSRGLFEWDEPRWSYGKKAVLSQLDLETDSLLQKAFLHRKKQAIELNDSFSSTLEEANTERPEFGTNSLSNQLEMVFEVIQAREVLGLRRQTFFVMLGGWDHHSELLGPHADLLGQLDLALGSFQTALNEAGLGESVTTFTASDFGRSLTSNGQGSDHGWGGNQLVMGGAVNGGEVYGAYPDLYLDSPFDVGRGRMLPTTSVDEYFAELACWFGISRNQLPVILPHLNRFYDLQGTSPPLGFMGS